MSLNATARLGEIRSTASEECFGIDWVAVHLCTDVFMLVVVVKVAWCAVGSASRTVVVQSRCLARSLLEVCKNL